ncbi:MAG TPA: DJ-1/PfpI family protein [Acidimicrobiales bacterium]|jgi:putative intracellular protease/amidase|nr:DJ-1/PfpI family protein [Acidimicrobiales bacterium]
MTAVQIAIAVFDQLTALDAIGPYAVLVQIPGAEVVFVAEQAGPVRDDWRALTLAASASFADVPRPDIALVPGGMITRRMYRDGHPVIDWAAAVHPTTQWTASVCTGALLLGAAGLLRGLDAATHWSAYEDLAALGARPAERRVVVQREHRIITGAGVSAGIDMALRLAAEVAGGDVAQRIQLGIEYDPQPPFDAGSPRTAPPGVFRAARERIARGLAQVLDI